MSSIPGAMGNSAAAGVWLPAAVRCGSCGDNVPSEAVSMGWPVPGPDGDPICPSCYGDEAFCPNGHVLPATADSVECSTCEVDAVKVAP